MVDAFLDNLSSYAFQGRKSNYLHIGKKENKIELSEVPIIGFNSGFKKNFNENNFKNGCSLLC
jgi:hypothetical protein